MSKEYLVIGRTDGTTRNGSPFVNLKVTNLEGTENIAVWDVPKTAGPKVGQTVIFMSIKDNGGKKSASNLDMTVGTFPVEGHPLYHLMPRPVKREEWDKCVGRLLSFCTDAQLRPIIEDFSEKLYRPYSEKPAATSVHHAFPGGLLNHTYQMLNMLSGLYPTLPYAIKIERCILAILFHDYGKVYEYNREGETQESMYLLGHIYISAHLLHNVLKEKGVDEREIDRIVHGVLAHHGQLEYGSPVMPCTQEAVIVTLLDNLSAKTDTIEGTGNMEHSFPLGTHVVK